jgi:hypothetical protein
MRSSTDLNALSSLLVEKKLEIPWVHNPDIVALTGIASEAKHEFFLEKN